MAVSEHMVTCRACGSDIEASALLCPKCGAPNVSTSFASTSSYFEEKARPAQVSLTPLADIFAPTSAAAPESDTVGSAAPAKTPAPAAAPQPPSKPGGREQTPSQAVAPAAAPAHHAPAPAAASSPESAAAQAFAAAPQPGRPIKLPGGEQPAILLDPYRPAPPSPPAYGTSAVRHVASHVRSAPQRAVRPRSFTPFLELLGYIGILGVGHMVSGELRTGAGLFFLWVYAWVQWAPAVFNGADETPLIIIGYLVVPPLSAAYAWSNRRAKSRKAQ